MKVLKLYPECKDYIWGGCKLKTKYNKQTEMTPCAESWELSFHRDGMTRLADGRTLAEALDDSAIGARAREFPFFPLLVKFIDARENLSVQVHPSDDYALENENSFGKTEMWYIVEADEGAGVYLGFNRDVTREEYERAIADGTLMELLNFYEAKAGDCFFIPSGTVHAIGGGCLICEIQQNSNLTYRVYDYGRRDAQGRARELHIERALAVSDLTRYEKQDFGDGVLGSSKYFSARKLIGESCLQTDGGSFHCLTCVSGSGEIEGEPIALGESFLVPANYGEYRVSGEIELILTEIGV